jgi:hypothetical protein
VWQPARRSTTLQVSLSPIPIDPASPLIRFAAQETAGNLPSSPQFQWTTTQTFSGTGLQKTDTFTVGDHWRIVWSCDPGSVEGEDYLVLIEVDAPDGSILDRGVETLCQQHTTHGIDEMYSGGQVSLHVVCIGKWTVQVQEWQEAESSAA